MSTQSPTKDSSDVDDVEPACPASWDMFTCWDRASANTLSKSPCPHYLVSGSVECIKDDVHYSERECTTDGVWNSNMSLYLGESSYKRCADSYDCFLELQQTAHLIQIVCQSISIAALIPAIFILLSYRNLRTQHRIRIHINLFLALLVFHTVHMIYQLTVRHHNVVEQVFADNPVECRVLNALSQFSVLCMYLWMFMEGFYLHWLMANAFHQPKLYIISIFGWGVPFIITIIYAIIKATDARINKGCWFEWHDINWLINIPLILCLALNFVFLLNIQRILKQLTQHRNEPGYYRRAVKASFVLIPTFGLTLLLLIYSPSYETNYRAKLIYDCFAQALTHLQGLFITIILCYSNGEVITCLRKSCPFACPLSNRRLLAEGSTVTAMTHVSRRTSSFNSSVLHPQVSPTTQEMQLLVQQHVSQNGITSKQNNNNENEEMKPLRQNDIIDSS